MRVVLIYLHCMKSIVGDSLQFWSHVSVVTTPISLRTKLFLPDITKRECKWCEALQLGGIQPFLPPLKLSTSYDANIDHIAYHMFCSSKWPLY